MDSVGVRIQKLSVIQQVLSIARLAEGRSVHGRFTGEQVNKLFEEFALPKPARVSATMDALKNQGLLTRVTEGGAGWKLTPIGRQRAEALASDMDLAALSAESTASTVTLLAGTPHPMIPPSLAPPELIGPLHSFLAEHPFETNVFGMTRFPSKRDESKLDPIGEAITAARDACAGHGLEFHLASDRQIVDDLWPNVAAHLWGSRYAIAFFEDRTEGGLNYNLTIEVGSCLVLGRRIGILKDEPVEKLPSDLTSKIYKEVDFAGSDAVSTKVHEWIRDDLNLGVCPACAKP
jgi:hypothetical protein